MNNNTKVDHNIDAGVLLWIITDVRINMLDQAKVYIAKWTVPTGAVNNPEEKWSSPPLFLATVAKKRIGWVAQSVRVWC